MKTNSTILKITLFFLLNFVAVSVYSNGNYVYTSPEIYKDSISQALEDFRFEEATDCAIYFAALSKEENNLDDYLDALYYIYCCYSRQNKYTTAFTFFKNELAWNEKKGNKENVINIKYLIALSYEDVNNKEKAHQYFLSSLRELERFDGLAKEKELASYFYIYTELAKVLIESDARESLQYLEKAYFKAIVLNDSIVIADSYLNIAWANIEIQNFEIAETYLDSALVIFEEKESVKGRASIFLEKGIIQENKNNLIDALTLFLTSYDILFVNEVKGSYFLKNKTLNHLVTVFKKKDELGTALQYALENLGISQKYKSKPHIAANAKTVAELYDLNKQSDLALEYYKLSNEYFQLLEEEDSRLNVLRQEYQYQNQKKEELLSSAIVLGDRNNQKVWILSIFILVMISSAYHYFRKMNSKYNMQTIELKEKEDVITEKIQSMADLSLINQSRNQYFVELKENLKRIYKDSETKSPELKKMISQLKRTVNKEQEWERFRGYHAELEPAFYQEIEKKYPKLTNLDIRHCTLIKLKLSTKEAADVLGISPKSVQMARYRLKKKLNCESQDSLKQFLVSI